MADQTPDLCHHLFIPEERLIFGVQKCFSSYFIHELKEPLVLCLSIHLDRADGVVELSNKVPLQCPQHRLHEDIFP